MGFNGERTLTVVPTAVARGLDGDRVTISSGLARALLLVHRMEYSLYGGPKNVGPRAWSKGLVERTLGARAFAEPGMHVRRYSPIARESLDGAVYFREATQATVESLTKLDGPLPKGADQLHVVVLRWDEPFVPGDGLLVNGAPHVLEAVEPDEACWVRGPSLGGWQGTVSRVTPTLAQRVGARGIGPYSQLTQRPLSPAGTITHEQLVHLATRGCLAIVGEVASLRSESLKLRTWGYESLVRRARIRDPLALLQPRRATAVRDPDAEAKPFAEPEEWALTGSLPTLQAAVAAAFACGFELGQAVPRLSLGLARIGTGSEWSRGRVLSAATVDLITRRPIPGGLDCQRLFGPTQDDECACGKLRGKEARGSVCKSCGVEVTRALVRRTRFAHVALSCLVVPAPYRSLVAQLLDEAPEVTEQRLVRDGGDAVLAQLEAIDLAARATTLGVDHPLARLHATGLSPADLLWSVLPVLPADLRPVVPAGGGRSLISDVTQRYRIVVERDLALRGLLDVGAAPALVEAERARLLGAVQGLFEGERPGDAQKRPLGSLQGLLAWCVKPSARRNVDYAASLVAVVDPSLHGSAAVVCEDALTEVLLPRLYGLLEHRGQVTNIKDAKSLIETDAERRRALTAEVAQSLSWLVMHADAKRVPTVVAVTPTPGHEPNVRLSPELAQRLDARTGDVLCVHLPVCDEAASEARWLERFPTGKFRAHQPVSSGLLEALTQVDSWDPLVHAALAGTSEDGSSLEAGLLVGGFDLVRFPRPLEDVW